MSEGARSMPLFAQRPTSPWARTSPDRRASHRLPATLEDPKRLVRVRECTRALAVTALLAASLAAALAGSPPSRSLTVRVPFDFRAGESGFGPGEYVISLSADAPREGIPAGTVRLEGRERGQSTTLQAQ